jgi:isopentenyl-diphosphate Delta-isomerase
MFLEKTTETLTDTFEQVILVNPADEELGHQNKLLAHEQGQLHRAFSIFIFNQNHQLLLQQRAMGKYHSPGLWTNTCCSHPQPGLSMEQALQQRLSYEMGMSCALQFSFKFLYKTSFANGLTEHELDHVYIGHTNTLPMPNPSEVLDYKYISIPDLKKDLGQNPQAYTAWMRIIMDKVPDNFGQKMN